MNPRPESTRLSNSYRQLSAPSSSITSGSCVSGDDDESSILLAISTLFQEDGCDSGDLPPEEGAVQTNKIVARVIPRDQIEYERLKPVDRLCDAGLLRQKLNEESDGMDHFLVTHEKARELNRAEINPSSRKMVAVLKVDAIIPSWHTPSIRYRIQMNMQYVLHTLNHKSMNLSKHETFN